MERALEAGMTAAPLLFGLLALLAWEAAVARADVPPYILPGPVAIIAAFPPPRSAARPPSPRPWW